MDKYLACNVSNKQKKEELYSQCPGQVEYGRTFFLPSSQTVCLHFPWTLTHAFAAVQDNNKSCNSDKGNPCTNPDILMRSLPSLDAIKVARRKTSSIQNNNPWVFCDAEDCIQTD